MTNGPRTALDLLLTDGPRLSVGLLSADLLHLGDDLAAVERAGVGLVHIDVGDGAFSPLFTVGMPFVAAVTTPLLKDVHLMVENPLEMVAAFVAAGADMVTFHVEGARQPHRVLQVLGSLTNVNDPDRGLVRGVAVNPSTRVDVIEPFLDELDYVLLLAINPGWGGQEPVSTIARRVDEARALVERSGRPIAIGLDGGVTRANIRELAATGPDVIVSGSAVFADRAVEANAGAMAALIRSRAGVQAGSLQAAG
jgi:ribulose-phosphate 3-epimerase